jgi:formylglycine-generating enzyme required for sulfatase activity
MKLRLLFLISLAALAALASTTASAQRGLTNDPSDRAPPSSNKVFAEKPSSLEPGELLRECPECPELVIVPPGDFVMGSPDTPYEKPERTLSVRRPFAIGRREVTFAEWDHCADAGACKHRPDDRGWGRGERPVMNVSWDDVKLYTAWLSQKTGQRYRLPSEAEWEYAARGGTQTRYWWGDQFQPGMVNCKNCSDILITDQPVKVGSLKPNPFGLFDMGGGVDQWVEDCWHKNYQGAPADGSAWIENECPSRVIRSGSWRKDSSYARTANRGSYDTNVRYPTHGFRVALSL